MLYSVPMQTEIEFAAQRFSVFAGQVIEPAVYESTAALDAAAMQCTDPIAHEEAVRGAYQPVPLGWRWGPVWSTAWFRVTGHVPAGMRGRKVVLRFSSGTEATLWRDGVPYFGFDPNHDAVTLFDRAAGGEAVELFIEAACNRPLGATFFWWDTPELRQQWEGPAPGRLTHCELAVFNPEIWRLWRTYDFARQLLLLCPPDSPRARSLIDGLRRATALLDPGNIHEQAARAQEELGAALRGQPPTRTRCIAVGQGHMDTAWLWRFRETRRKCLRTFSTALRLMEEFPDYHFLWSQAQQYAWVQQDSPGLFARVAERVREGRWEASGAMWVEPDCNVPSGESLVRQILHAARWWQRAFGAHGRQTFLYLPDTFGFSAALPQIMDLAGLGTFITNKMSWNDMNEFPYTTFRWRGLDGTEVTGHCTPGRDYNANLTPVELQRGEKEISRKNGGATAAWLQPFGFGDGGGGPTAGMLQNALIARECEGLPEVRMGRTESLCAELHRQREELRAQGQDLPAWDGELYLEYHRGTYTTQAWLKQANRRHEQALRAAEWLAFAGPAAPDAARTAGIMRRLDEAWKLLLLDQFHDVLPGSSIAEVYADVRQQQAQIEATCEAIIREETTRWASAADNRGRRRPMAVFNSCAAARGGVVDCEGETHYVAAVPAMARLSSLVLTRFLCASRYPLRLKTLLSNGRDRRAGRRGLGETVWRVHGRQQRVV